MLRSQVLKLYKSFFRVTYKNIPKSQIHQRQEILNWVRSDFRANSSISHQKEDEIKALMAYGEKMLHELRQSVELSKA